MSRPHRPARTPIVPVSLLKRVKFEALPKGERLEDCPEAWIRLDGQVIGHWSPDAVDMARTLGHEYRVVGYTAEFEVNGKDLNLAVTRGGVSEYGRGSFASHYSIPHDAENAATCRARLRRMVAAALIEAGALAPKTSKGWRPSEETTPAVAKSIGDWKVSPWGPNRPDRDCFWCESRAEAVAEARAILAERLGETEEPEPTPPEPAAPSEPEVEPEPVTFEGGDWNPEGNEQASARVQRKEPEPEPEVEVEGTCRKRDPIAELRNDLAGLPGPTCSPIPTLEERRERAAAADAEDADAALDRLDAEALADLREVSKAMAIVNAPGQRLDGGPTCWWDNHDVNLALAKGERRGWAWRCSITQAGWTDEGCALAESLDRREHGPDPIAELLAEREHELRSARATKRLQLRALQDKSARARALLEEIQAEAVALGVLDPEHEEHAYWLETLAKGVSCGLDNLDWRVSNALEGA